MAKQKRHRPIARSKKPSTPITTRPRSAADSLQSAAWFTLAALAVSFYLHFNSEKIADPDSFYHFRHAALYAEGGLFSAGFPWIPYSIINKYSADIWYGFHVLLIPFVWIDDPLIGIRLAGVFVTASYLFVVYHVCRKLEIKLAPVWPFILLFSSAFLLHRLTMLRPHVLSLGLSMLLLTLLASAKLRAVFLAAFALTWLHLSLFFVPIIVCAVYVSTKLLIEKSLAWRESLALIGGLIAGWLVRPNPFGAAQIAYVQVFQWTLEKIAGTPFDVGSELRPLTIALHSNYLAIIGLWSLGLLFLLWKLLWSGAQLPVNQRTILCSTAVLSLGFFLLALLFARRAFDFSSSFGIIMLGLVFSHFLASRKWLRIGIFGIFGLLAIYGTSLRNRVLAIGWPIDRVAGAARWLEANSRPGDIVFNVRWEYFPELFFWNTKNYFVAGMDPIFQHVFDPALYRAGLSIGTARDPLLCAPGNCLETPGTVSYQVLKERFKARYVFLLKQADANVYFNLLNDKRFELKNDDDGAAVFEVH